MTDKAKVTKNLALDAKLKAVQAKDIMSKSVLTTTPFARLSEVATQMIQHRISGMPVIAKDGSVSGVVTASDLFIILAMILDGNTDKFGSSPENPCVDVAMTTDAITVVEETGLDEIVHLMRNESAHTIPVMKQGKLVGVIGRHDVLRKFYEVTKN